MISLPSLVVLHHLHKLRAFHYLGVGIGLAAIGVKSSILQDKMVYLIHSSQSEPF